jgi:predicted peptidase
VKDILKGAADLGEPVYLIAPQCPPERWWAEPSPDRLALKEAGGANPLLDAVLALVGETAKSNPVDPNRIYVTGLSMGGFGTWALLTRSPETWAAAIPICGAGDPASASKFKDIPIRIFHGAADEIVPPKGRELGGKAELNLYAGVGHNSWSKTYKDPEVIKWLLSQKKPD